MKKTILSLSIIVSLAIPATSFAAFGTDIFQPQAIFSGVNATTSSSTAQTLGAGDVTGYSTILFTPTVGSDTLTLPASSTLAAWLPAPGLRLSMFLFNASTTAGINVIVVGNSANGSILENSSSTATITSLRGAFLDVMREPTTATSSLGNFLWTIIPTI